MMKNGEKRKKAPKSPESQQIRGGKSAQG